MLQQWMTLVLEFMTVGKLIPLSQCYSAASEIIVVKILIAKETTSTYVCAMFQPQIQIEMP